MFDLAAAIEDYPQFLRGWIDARVLERTAGGSRVEQVLGFGPMRLRFRSLAVFRRPQRIEVTSADPPFRQFSLTWQIEPRSGGGCRVGVEADVQLLSWLTQQAVDRILPGAVEEFMTAIEARAGQLYAPPGNLR